MTKLLAFVQQLTDDEKREVEEYAESVLKRRPRPAHSDAPVKTDFGGWAGALAHVHPEYSDEEFNKLILDEWAQAAED